MTLDEAYQLIGRIWIENRPVCTVGGTRVVDGVLVRGILPCDGNAGGVSIEAETNLGYWLIEDVGQYDRWRRAK